MLTKQVPLSTHDSLAKQQDASQPKLLNLQCWKCHIWEKKNVRWDNRASPPHPHAPIHPSHKKAKSHSALQLYVSLQGFLQLSASYSNPQLLPTRNLTVRNLSARRLKPEECYCSGHSCKSSGLVSAATVCVEREEGEGGGGGGGRRAGGIEGVKKATFTCFQCSVVSWQSST